MDNSFKNHEVNYLSPSSINEYIINPAKWVLTYVHKYRDVFGNAAMWRGIATEFGITESLRDGRISISTAQFRARSKFLQLKDEFLNSEEIRKNITQAHLQNIMKKVDYELATLPKYVEIGVPYFRNLGKPTHYQKKIKLEIDGLPIPIIGYTDLQYDGIVRDIKTTNRLPSKISDSINRQLAIYATAENSLPIVDYVYATKTTQKVVSRPVENVESIMKEVEIASFNMMKMLSFSTDINEVASLIFPNFDDWRWSENEKNEAKKLWRI